jgi:hypothetical protein
VVDLQERLSTPPARQRLTRRRAGAAEDDPLVAYTGTP